MLCDGYNIDIGTLNIILELILKHAVVNKC